MALNGLSDAHHKDYAGCSLTPASEQWQRLLWRRQPFPDNYVPESFLSELKDLPLRERPRLLSLVVAGLPISQHLAVIAIFLSVFRGLLNGFLGAGQVGWTCVSCSLIGFAVHAWGWGMAQETAHASIRQGQGGLLPPSTPLRPLILPPLLLSLLSPILGTLTSATTSDTIWPLAGGLFFLHILLGDFATGPDARVRRAILQGRRARRASISSAPQMEDIEEKSLTSSLSLTSALSASIVLASRLSSTSQVFSLILLAVALFAGWPHIAKGVRESGKVYSVALTASSVIMALSLSGDALSPTSHVRAGQSSSPPATTIFLLASIVLVNVVGPWMLWYGWRWKMQRGGGWDVAVVRIRRDRAGKG